MVALRQWLAPGLFLVRAYELERDASGRLVQRHAPILDAEVDRMNWRAYSITTSAEKDCSGCGTSTVLPGKRYWRWRWRAPTSKRRGGGRTTESICPACYGKLAEDER
jgi:hypothetical protein